MVAITRSIILNLNPTGFKLTVFTTKNAKRTGRIVGHKNILIPLAQDSKDLKALHHAISLAERIEARIQVIWFKPETWGRNKKSPVIEACLDVIHIACENGQKISFLIASDSFEKAETKFIKLLDKESIDLIIISDTETKVAQMIRSAMPSISCEIVQVRKKMILTIYVERVSICPLY